MLSCGMCNMRGKEERIRPIVPKMPSDVLGTHFHVGDVFYRKMGACAVLSFLFQKFLN